jgi:hypothetical protein
MGERGKKIYKMELGADGKYHRVQYLKTGKKVIRSKYAPKTVAGKTRAKARQQLPLHKKKRVLIPRAPTPKGTKQSQSSVKRYQGNVGKSNAANKLVDSYARMATRK